MKFGLNNKVEHHVSLAFFEPDSKAQIKCKETNIYWEYTICQTFLKLILLNSPNEPSEVDDGQSLFYPPSHCNPFILEYNSSRTFSHKVLVQNDCNNAVVFKMMINWLLKLGLETVLWWLGCASLKAWQAAAPCGSANTSGKELVQGTKNLCLRNWK